MRTRTGSLEVLCYSSLADDIEFGHPNGVISNFCLFQADGVTVDSHVLTSRMVRMFGLD